MKISVALPTCNGARYLEAQLASLVSQTRLPDELVVADDRSDDATPDVVRAFGASAPFPVRFILNESRLGCNANFANAMSQCSGDIIALCDQDDVWVAEHVQRLSEPFYADAAVGVVTSDSAYVDERLNPLNITFWQANHFGSADVKRIARGPQFAQFARHHVLAGHASAIRRSLLDVALPLETMMYDHWIGLICAALSRIVFIEATLTLHRRHAAQQSPGNQAISLVQRTLTQPSTAAEHFRALAAQWRLLRNRLAAVARTWQGEAVVTVCDGRIRLLEARAAMRDVSPWRRVNMACRRLLSGDYHVYGRGGLTFLRDIRG